MSLTVHFLCYLVVPLLIVNGEQIVGDFEVDFCREAFSDCRGEVFNRALSWIRFKSFINGDEIFWLKIKRKKDNQYPIIVKVGNKQTYNLSTLSEITDCHFEAVGNLQWGSKAASIVLPSDVSGPYSVSLCGGISGIVLLAGGGALVRIDPLGPGHPRGVTLVEIPILYTEEGVGLAPHDHLRREAGRPRGGSHERLKRSFRMPAHRPPGPFLVELYLIADSRMAAMYRREDYSRLIARIRAIVNQINLAFMQFNIYFVVVQLEIWEYDQIRLTDDNHILLELQQYKSQLVSKRHDCLHAILGESPGSKRRGASETASMCSTNRCVAYTKDYLGMEELEIAHSVMHEIGHNFGLSHDTERCRCFGCIMATGVEFGSRKFQWSNCSRREMPSLLAAGMADCLKDGTPWRMVDVRPLVMTRTKVPRTLPEMSMAACGNGVVDDGEDCDCGGRALCTPSEMRCCNPDSCQLQAGARCASGACCDITNCSLRPSGFVCRKTGTRDCDLPEYCNGTSEWCPADVYKVDGAPCLTSITRESSHCYRGECDARGSRCVALFGEMAKEASSRCFEMNRIGDRIRNCGLEALTLEDRERQSKSWPVQPCSSENLRCGRLWCSHDNERMLRPSPVMEADQMVEGIHCAAASFDIDWFLDDAGLVPNGAPCGSDKMCWRGECVQAAPGALGGCHCHGHGVCNNRGHCHCDGGFSPPNCTDFGDGGSVDSGPPIKFHQLSTVVVVSVLVVVVLLVAAFLILILLYHYNTRRWPPIFAKIRFFGYRLISRAFKSRGFKPRRPRKCSLEKNPSCTVLLSEGQADNGPDERSDLVLKECLKRIHSSSEHLSLDELNVVLDHVFKKKTSSAEDSIKETKDGRCKNFRSPPRPLVLKIDPSDSSVRSLCAPVSPDKLSPTRETTVATPDASGRSSPTVLKNPKKPSTVKARAELFERPPSERDLKSPPWKTSRPVSPPGKGSRPVSPPPGIGFRPVSPPPGIDSKSPPWKTTRPISPPPGKDSRPVSPPGKGCRPVSPPPGKGCRPVSPPGKGSNPVSPPPGKYSRPVSPPWRDSRSPRGKTSKPLSYSGNDSKPPLTFRLPPSACSSIQKTPSKTRAPPTDHRGGSVAAIATSKAHPETRHHPAAGPKPKKSLSEDLAEDLASTCKGNQPKTSSAVKMAVGNPPSSGTVEDCAKTSRPGRGTNPPERSAVPARTTKDQISQPTLDQTTCTVTTQDLAHPDQTLSRKIAPHKVLKVDPGRAVKYLY